MWDSEEQLVRDLRAGDNLAYAALYNRYKRSVFVFCAKMLMNREKAKDAVQDIFLKVYEHRHQLEQPARFRSWLFAIARNQCYSVLRGSKHGPMEEIVEDSVRTGPEEDLELVIERHEEAELVNKYLAALKMEYREVLVLREFQNLSYKEIAEVLGTTESAIKSRIFKARQRLFELLKPILRERG